MQAGEFDEPVDVLSLQKPGNVYTWIKDRRAWVKAEPQAGKNLFSTVGIGVRSVKFTVRKQNLTLHNAIRWQGKHCFLTDITEIGQMYYEILAALIEPTSCIVKRIPPQEKDELNRPKKSEAQVIMTFPGCLTEKYMGFAKLNPQVQTNTQYVLVTPKEIGLKIADLVVIEGTTYNVQILHELDEFKNEYEIAVSKEA